MRVEARDLSRRFGAVEALRGLTFAIEPGRRVALIGPNGSGKSTLNRILLGLLRFDGRVEIDGHCPLRERMHIADRIAYVPQVAPPLGATVGQLVATIARVRSLEPEAIARIARRLGLEPAEVARHPFRSLSGGMRQKLLVATALASEPSLIILDEPTASLDAHSRERFFGLFDELARDATVVLCSHRLEEVRQLVDGVLLLDEGRLVHDGPAASFLAASTTSLIEVCVDGEAAARWLSLRGFRAGPGGWWIRAASAAERARLVPELAATLGAALRDLTVRELEVVEPGARAERHDAA